MPSLLLFKVEEERAELESGSVRSKNLDGAPFLALLFNGDLARACVRNLKQSVILGIQLIAQRGRRERSKEKTINQRRKSGMMQKKTFEGWWCQ